MEDIQVLLELIKNPAVLVGFLIALISFLWEKFYKAKPSVDPTLKNYIKSINNPGYISPEARKKAKQEKREKKKQEKIEKERLIKKYGELDGLLIFDGTISEKEFLRKKKIIKKYGEDIGEKIFYKILFIDMTKDMVIDALGNPSDIKETVTREKTTNKYYYHPRKTRQSTTVYRLEVTLENDVVSGWKDLE